MRVISSSGKAMSPACIKSTEEVFSTSDVISLHVPKTAGVILNRDAFSLLGKRTTIVNSSGHEVIDTTLLYTYLKNNPAASYIFLAKPDEDHFRVLAELKNTYLYPLFANQTLEAKVFRREHTLRNLNQFLAGKEPIGRVI